MTDKTNPTGTDLKVQDSQTPSITSRDLASEAGIPTEGAASILRGLEVAGAMVVVARTPTPGPDGSTPKGRGLNAYALCTHPEGREKFNAILKALAKRQP